MKTLRSILLLVVIIITGAANLLAQVPQAFHYQAVARNASGEIMANHTISVKIGILKGSDSGDPAYTETHSVITNEVGIFTLEIGAGSQSGDNEFINVGWENDNYFLSIAIDINGGTDYEELGSSKLLSVPYAIVSQRSVESEFTSDIPKGIDLNTSEGDTTFIIKAIGTNSLTSFRSEAATSAFNRGLMGVATSAPENDQQQQGVLGSAPGDGTGAHIGVFGSAVNDNGTGGIRYGVLGQARSQGRFNMGLWSTAFGPGDGEIVPIGDPKEAVGNVGSLNFGVNSRASGNLNGNVGVFAYVFGSEGARGNWAIEAWNHATSSGPNTGVGAEAKGSQTINTAIAARALGDTENIGVDVHSFNGTLNIGLRVNAQDIAAVFNGPLTEVNGNLSVNGDINYSGSLSNTSDRNLKENIMPMENALDMIMKLAPASYNFRTDKIFRGMNLSAGLHYGLIAQDVELLLPSLVRNNVYRYNIQDMETSAGPHEYSDVNMDEMVYKSLNYTELIPFLIKSIQEQQQIIEELRKDVEKLKN